MMASVASMTPLFDLMFPSSSGYSSSSFSLSSIHHISIYSLTFWWMVVSHIFNRWPVKITLRPALFLPSAPFLFRSPLTAPFQIGWIGWIGWTNSVRPSNWWNRSNWQKKISKWKANGRRMHKECECAHPHTHTDGGPRCQTHANKAGRLHK